MQEALLQGCRRSGRLLKRAAGLSPTATRALHQDAENTAAGASEGPKRRRRKVAASTDSENGPEQQDHQHTKQQVQKQQADTTAGIDQLQALGSITNRADILETLNTAAAEAGAAAAPPTKRGRGRPPRAATAAAAQASSGPPASAAATADPGQGAGLNPADITAAAGPTGSKGKHKGPAAGSKGSGRASSKSGSGPSRATEQRLWAQGYQAVAGVDEAGRGPLAGPVVAAAAVLPPGVEFALLNDSKQMSEEEREAVYERLTTHPDVSYAVAVVDAATIDRINILQAAMLAMKTAVEGLAGAGLKADHLLIDGNRKPPDLDETPVQLVVKGDATVTCIAAASVLAKVTRDRMMLELDQQYPQYGFAQHKGYGVPAHKAAIQKHGPCPVHRRSFEPVKSLTKWPGYPKPPGAAVGAVTVAVARPRSSAGAGAKPPAGAGLGV